MFSINKKSAACILSSIILFPILFILFNPIKNIYSISNISESNQDFVNPSDSISDSWFSDEWLELRNFVPIEGDYSLFNFILSDSYNQTLFSDDYSKIRLAGLICLGREMFSNEINGLINTGWSQEKIYKYICSSDEAFFYYADELRDDIEQVFFLDLFPTVDFMGDFDISSQEYDSEQNLSDPNDVLDSSISEYNVNIRPEDENILDLYFQLLKNEYNKKYDLNTYSFPNKGSAFNLDVFTNQIDSINYFKLKNNPSNIRIYPGYLNKEVSPLGRYVSCGEYDDKKSYWVIVFRSSGTENGDIYSKPILRGPDLADNQEYIDNLSCLSVK